ncbi:tRNA pseudouridine synthase A [Hartmannibacter diazotrophicus]|uniref:tRNA pseudouridine synthase A n=1 Tax=Hartmannibacter diazotrophicus TaxID=1482074 RepID=A0A2C9D063_9HYPH|nr:tRNA pseudouridine(38-40) synthase TruA [Hartmannibacter diazotrophicus]SON53650.1 tRNA pseudouridine synthase A [Hartmannibacter diazotrophicus]
MPRYRMLIEYDGTPFVGWQRQANGVSVQGVIEEAIGKITPEKITLKGAGRTDTGVHATGQVAHVDLEKVMPADTLRDATNFHIEPHPVSILAAEVVDETFDSRFSATKRHYHYRIVDRRAPLALDRYRAWHVRKPLDVDAMQAAAGVLVGHHDFTTFRSTHCQSKSPVKTLDGIDITREGEAIVFHVWSRSFLHNQVRSIVGSLKKVGDGSWTAGTLAAALDARDRRACGPVAPAHGLTLTQVDY